MSAFDLDVDVIETFIMSMTIAELEYFQHAAQLDEDNLETTGYADVLAPLTVAAARRLGHGEITAEDAQTISMVDAVKILAKAAHVPPHRHQRVDDLLATLGE